jgi:hypothetical protein
MTNTLMAAKAIYRALDGFFLLQKALLPFFYIVAAKRNDPNISRTFERLVSVAASSIV